MTGTIKVDSGKLSSTAASFQGTGNQIKNLTNQMTAIVTSLNGQVWSGDAAAAYKNKFDGLQDDINRMISMINEHVTDLQEMTRRYEQVESANITTANALTSDAIV